jgi:hypothetical protein
MEHVVNPEAINASGHEDCAPRWCYLSSSLVSWRRLGAQPQ